MISSKFPVVWCYFFSETIFPWWKILALWRHWKRKKDLFFINPNSFRVNKVYHYLTLTLRNFISPLYYILRLRVFSICIASGKELSEFLLPIFSSSLYLWGFLVTNCCFHLASNTHESNYSYFILKQKFSWNENFAVLPLLFKKQRTQNVKKICEPEIKILHFFRYHFVMCTFLLQIAAFT